MGLIYTTQIQNQSCPHVNLSMLPYLLHRFIVTIRCRGSQKAFAAKWLPLGYHHFLYQWCPEQEQEQAKWTRCNGPPKNVIGLLPYIGLHSNLITKRLKSCVNRSYSFVNGKVIFQNTRRIKSFFPYKDRLNRSQLSKVGYKASCWDCNDFYIGKTLPPENGTFQGPFETWSLFCNWPITLKQLVTASNWTILTFWHTARLTTTVKLRRPCLSKSYCQQRMPMSAVKSIYSIKEAFSWSLYRLFQFETS